MNGPATISVPLSGGLFNFRAAGVAVVNGKLLLHKTSADKFWSLPGGRADMFETTKETLLREMMEETGMTVSVEQLMWIVENFFEYNQIRYHEIGFYYRMQFADLRDQNDFVVVENGSELLFHWHPLEELAAIKIHPNFITAELISDNTSPKHVVLNSDNLNLG
ncbi:NUDIX hydrolase [Dyadobacter psychrotolerans]|uniref:NUDIX domain-containing protein n=1 Tax=Dyadobacter psychrotolerans TaxID=2541721 RepID=A0A4R5DYX6_9BACT|nr:NUDIX hydrolase [Dyadobacter psychrotolerans]TDE16615.1 NUDIX domain-containing protein [Dyadobacter psychrotolerans]